jgi:hypothetical protein
MDEKEYRVVKDLTAVAPAEHSVQITIGEGQYETKRKLLETAGHRLLAADRRTLESHALKMVFTHHSSERLAEMVRLVEAGQGIDTPTAAIQAMADDLLVAAKHVLALALLAKKQRREL